MSEANDYWRSLLVWSDGEVVRKLSLKEAQALYPTKNPGTLDRDIRRAASRLGSSQKISVVKPVETLHVPDEVSWVTGKLPLQKDRLTKFVILFDMHYPYNVCFKQVKSFVRDFGPDYLIYGGDQLNMDAFSHWALKIPRSARELPLPKPYYDQANRDLFLPLREAANTASIIAIKGNHEDWADRAVDDEPRAEGYWETELNVDGVDQWVANRGMISLGKLFIIHGDAVEGTGSTNPARNLFLKGFHRNIIAGHLHTYSVSTEMSPIDQDDRHVAEYAPCLTLFNPPFMANRPHQWAQGFVYGYVEPHGNFYKTTVIITNDKFVAEGKLYA